MRKPIFAFLAAVLATAVVGAQTADVGPAGSATTAAPETPATQPAAEPPSVAAPEATARTPEEEARRAEVLARMGEQTLTVGQFEDMLSSQRIPAATRVTFADPEVLRTQLDQRVERMAMAGYARQLGVDKNADVVREVRKLYRKITVSQYVMEAVTPDSITDAEIQAFYEQRWDAFNRPETVKGGMILLPDREQAETALEQALAARGNRAQLVKLVQDLSTDEETRIRSGAIGFFDRDGRLNRAQHADEPEPPRVDPAIVAAAFTLTDPFDVYPQVVESARGPAVVFLFNRTEAVSRTVEEVADRIRPELLQERRRAAQDEYVAAVRARFHVVTNDANFEHVVVAPTPLASVANPNAGLPDAPPTLGPMAPSQVAVPLGP